jgi:hypothetical protein
MSCKKDCKPKHSPFLLTSWRLWHLVKCQDVLITHAWIIPCGSCNELYEWIPSHKYHSICVVRSYYSKTKQTPFPSPAEAHGIEFNVRMFSLHMHEYYVDVLIRCMNEYLHTQVSLDMSSGLSDPAPTSTPSKNSRSGISWMGWNCPPGVSLPVQ